MQAVRMYGATQLVPGKQTKCPSLCELHSEQIGLAILSASQCLKPELFGHASTVASDVTKKARMTVCSLIEFENRKDFERISDRLFWIKSRID